MKAIVLITLVSAFTFSTFAVADQKSTDNTQSHATQAQIVQKNNEETSQQQSDTDIIHFIDEYCASCVGGMF